MYVPLVLGPYIILNHRLLCMLLAQCCLCIFSSGADQPYQYPITSSPTYCSMPYNYRYVCPALPTFFLVIIICVGSRILNFTKKLRQLGRSYWCMSIWFFSGEVLTFGYRVILHWRISQNRTRSTAEVMLKAIHNRICSLDVATLLYSPCTSVRRPVCCIPVFLLFWPQSYSEAKPGSGSILIMPFRVTFAPREAVSHATLCLRRFRKSIGLLE